MKSFASRPRLRRASYRGDFVAPERKTSNVSNPTARRTRSLFSHREYRGQRLRPTCRSDVEVDYVRCLVTKWRRVQRSYPCRLVGPLRLLSISTVEPERMLGEKRVCASPISSSERPGREDVISSMSFERAWIFRIVEPRSISRPFDGRILARSLILGRIRHMSDGVCITRCPRCTLARRCEADRTIWTNSPRMLISMRRSQSVSSVDDVLNPMRWRLLAHATSLFSMRVDLRRMLRHVPRVIAKRWRLWRWRRRSRRMLRCRHRLENARSSGSSRVLFDGHFPIFAVARSASFARYVVTSFALLNTAVRRPRRSRCGFKGLPSLKSLVGLGYRVDLSGGICEMPLTRTVVYQGW